MLDAFFRASQTPKPMLVATWRPAGSNQLPISPGHCASFVFYSTLIVAVIIRADDAELPVSCNVIFTA
jgi:hypothetical protein